MLDLGLPENVNYFHTTLCSSRDLDVDGTGDFVVDPTTNPHTCLQTINNFLMDDAGGPGDRVKIIVTYEHEVIVPNPGLHLAQGSFGGYRGKGSSSNSASRV